MSRRYRQSLSGGASVLQPAAIQPLDESKSMPEEDRPLSTLEKMTQIVEAVAATPGGLQLTQVANALGLPKATAHRLLGFLCGVGLLVSGREARKIYHAGPRLMRLLRLRIGSDNVEAAAWPVLHRLVTAFGETAFLVKLVDEQVETLTMVMPVKDWQGHVHPGRIMPAHAAASAKAIFAFQDPELIKAVLRRPLPQFTKHTHKLPSGVEAEYAEIRRTGLATCSQEIDPGQIAYAAPVRIENFGVIFSICIVGPLERLTQHPIEEISQALRTAADEFGATLVRRMRTSGRHALVAL